MVALQVVAAQATKNSMHVSGSSYSDASLAFRYTPPKGMRDKTQRFRLQVEEQAKASGKAKTLKALLAMSSGPDDADPNWRSLTIETYPRTAVEEPDDTKAETRMNAWVADSNDTNALFQTVVISGQKFAVSVFGQQEGRVKKAAVVWTTVRRGQLLSFAFVGNSPEQLKKLTETMKTVQFF
jgi:hypothetical protein